ncbi:MAG: MbnP family copper-binding protein [Vicinamibacterales bacterium]
MRPITTAALVAVLLPSFASAQEPTPVRLRFDAVVRDQPVACGAKYDGIGTTASTISIADFRFYVSRVRLVTADGAEVPVTLEQDGLWQHEDVALLDFEDGTGACANGTPELRDFVAGTVPPGDYRGVRFDIGMPFDLNHREPTVAPSPLNLSRLFWSWNGGYKFARLDLRTTGQPRGWMIHLGSTGCSPSDTPSTVPMSCVHPNRVDVNLASFNTSTDVVRLDVAALLRESNVDANQAETPLGCMSGRSDAECPAILTALGLAEDGTPQRVFSVHRPATAARQ